MQNHSYLVVTEILRSGTTYPPGATINLNPGEARPLIDCGALTLPTPAQPESQVSAPEAVEEIAEPSPPVDALTAKTNLNTATRAMLESLEEVGPATAKKILAGRPYASLEAAQALSGMPPEQWAKISDRVEV